MSGLCPIWKFSAAAIRGEMWQSSDIMKTQMEVKSNPE